MKKRGKSFKDIFKFKKYKRIKYKSKDKNKLTRLEHRYI